MKKFLASKKMNDDVAQHLISTAKENTVKEERRCFQIY